MNNKIYALIAIVIAGFALVVSFNGNQNGNSFGGDTNFDSLDVSEGYKVDGTLVIDGGGGLTIASGTEATTITTSGDLHANQVIHSGGILDLGTSTRATGPASTSQMLAADICNYTHITLDPDDEDGGYWQFYSPSSQELAADCLGTNGDWIELILENDGTSTDAVISVVATTGIEVLYASSTDGLTSSSTALSVGEWAELKWLRKDASNTVLFMQKYAE